MKQMKFKGLFTLFFLALFVMGITMACGGNDPQVDPQPKPNVPKPEPSKPTETITRYVGGDISLLPEYEERDAQYFDGTKVVKPLELFKEQGMNAMRVRLFVDPSQYKGNDTENVIQHAEYVIALAKRIKAAGMKLLLDFHYSDGWADPGQQWIPKAWQNLSEERLQQTIYQYTVGVLNAMKKENVAPDFIQTGNEISYGMLVGTSKSDALWAYPSSPESNWTRFEGLLKQAIRACRETTPQAKVILHVERVSVSQQRDNKDYAALINFFQHMTKAGIDYDIIGLSYYPYFHGTLSELDGAISYLEKTYDKDIMLVETGYPYKWAVPGSTYDYTQTYPYSLEGQRKFTTDLIAMLRQHKRVTGLFWWWMEYNAKGTTLSNWYNAPLFDSQTGKATPALYELKAFVK